MSETQIVTTFQKVGLKDRLQALMEVIFEDSHFDPAIRAIIINLAKNFLRRSSDDDLRVALEKMRDEYIPFLLDEAPHDALEHPHQ